MELIQEKDNTRKRKQKQKQKNKKKKERKKIILRGKGMGDIIEVRAGGWVL